MYISCSTEQACHDTSQGQPTPDTTGLSSVASKAGTTC